MDGSYHMWGARNALSSDVTLYRRINLDFEAIFSPEATCIKNQGSHKQKTGFRQGLFERIGGLSRAQNNFESEPMIKEIASVAGACVFFGVTVICIAQFFRSKFPPSDPPPRY